VGSEASASADMHATEITRSTGMNGMIGATGTISAARPA